MAELRDVGAPAPDCARSEPRRPRPRRRRVRRGRHDPQRCAATLGRHGSSVDPATAGPSGERHRVGTPSPAPLQPAETLAIPGYISTEAFLSVIGLGVNPPTPSWGSMISDGSQVIRTYPNQTVFPALALAITMFAFNFLGDGLRDALDPRLRGTQ